MAQKKGGARKASNSRSKTTTRSGGSSAAAAHKAANAAKKPIRREVWALVCFFLAVFGLLGYFRIDAIFINLFAQLLGGLTGWGFYLYPVTLFAAAFILFTHRGRPVRARVAGALLLPVALGSLLFLLFNKTAYAWSWNLFPTFWKAGVALGNAGVLSGLLAMCFQAVFSKIGAIIVYLVLTIFLTMLTTNLTISNILEYLRNRERPAYEPESQEDYERRMEDRRQRELKRAEREERSYYKKNRVIDLPVDDPEEVRKQRAGAPDEAKQDVVYGDRAKKPGTIPFVFGDPVDLRAAKEPSTADKLAAAALLNNLGGIQGAEAISSGVAVENGRPEGKKSVPAPAVSPTSTPKPVPVPPPAEPEPAAEVPLPPLKEAKQPAAEQKAEVAEAAAAVAEQVEASAEPPAYEKPPFELLTPNPGGTIDATDELTLNSRRLNDALKSFSIDAHIISYTRGPTVTRYEIELEQGVKLTKLTSLSNDLALSLGASSVRIAPIPNKISVVGIEVPNKLVSTVYLREVIESDNFQHHKSKLAFALGKDIAGTCVVGDISKLPHLLIAGTTGSGKSVCMNSLIISLLYNASPEEVRLVMIDPKMIELGGYNGIPHLLIPVVTDPKKAAGALQWAVNEMMKRYRLFAELGVKDMDAYNEAAKKLPDRAALYRIVVVIDELADLMLVAAKEVEEYICRIAQMARAAGMHLVIATQRPSANVITGIMKANIPSRIAFAVASGMESRIILDTSGAEKLVGKGDMLYAPLGAGKPTRIQGTMVSAEEVEAVVEFIKQGATAEYSEDILEHIERHGAEKEQSASTAGGGEETPRDDGDELLPAAIEVVLDTGQASVSMLQRRLKLGYSRAARLVDQMEERGIVGPFEGSKPRQLLISKQQWQQMQMGGVGPADQPEPEEAEPEDAE